MLRDMEKKNLFHRTKSVQLDPPSPLLPPSPAGFLGFEAALVRPVISERVIQLPAFFLCQLLAAVAHAARRTRPKWHVGRGWPAFVLNALPKKTRDFAWYVCVVSVCGDRSD